MGSDFNANLQIKSSESDIQEKFKKLSHFNDVSDLLEISPKHLRYILFDMKNKYKSFNIPKKKWRNTFSSCPFKVNKNITKKIKLHLNNKLLK
ncbi:hypothetical protein [Rossellomorea aquimaris]|uniref:hypothetical protein n=1 Tax=Rossellomorea aquimaris TaxID=189382 RepID=UPI0024953DFD|nr:hypothetical protein [Rossellomorea aquimaris]